MIENANDNPTSIVSTSKIALYQRIGGKCSVWTNSAREKQALSSCFLAHSLKQFWSSFELKFVMLQYMWET